MNHYDQSRHHPREEVYKIRYYTGDGNGNGVKKTVSVRVRDYAQAERIADSFPNVAFVRKVDYDHIREFETSEMIKRIHPQPLEIETNPLALNDMIWLRKNKRRESIENQKKEKMDGDRDTDS